MKKLEIKRLPPPSDLVEWNDGYGIDLEATLQALCDAVNELQVIKVADGGQVHIHTAAGGGGSKLRYESCPCGEKSPHTHDTGITAKRFKADDIILGNDSDWGYPALFFKSEAEAQAALEALLNL